jgi:hypothetical protein
MATSDDSDELTMLPQRNPAWRTETVLAIARGIRLDDAFDRYPILADALEEAGCDDYDLLAMLRSEGSDCGDVLDWVLEGDPGIDALLAARLEQNRLESLHSAQLVRDFRRKRKPSYLKKYLLALALGYMTFMVLCFFFPQLKSINKPKESDTNRKYQNGNKLKSMKLEGNTHT